MPWSDVIGQAEPIIRLRSSAAGGRLGQAYAFVGPPGVGKKRCALAFAQALLCERAHDDDLDACGHCPSCQQVAARIHPDLLTVELPKDRAEIPVALIIGDGEERGRAGLCYELSLHPMLGRRKVAIIDDAECLNEAGANALLKTLEEPPPGVVIILVVSALEQLLPTIRSRCQLLTFQPLLPTDLRAILKSDPELELPEDLGTVVALSEGSLMTARQLLDPDLRQQRKKLYEHLSNPKFDGVQLADYAKSLMEGSSTVKAGQRSHAGWMIRFCIEFFRQALLAVSQGGQAPREFSEVARFIARYPESSVEQIDRLVELLDRCLLADRQIEANASLALCLEALFDDLGKLLRAPLA